MVVFARTFTAAHLAVLRRGVDPDDPTVLAARHSGGFLLLTRHRLVVTRRTRFLNRLRLHLNANLRHLSNLSWSADARQQALTVNLTAIDGVREKFVLRLAGADEVWRAEAVFRDVVRQRTEDLVAVA
jgi:hypothetical protein